MDLFCISCGEPWDISCIAEVKHGEDNDPAWKLTKSGYPQTCPCCPKGKDGLPEKQGKKNSRAAAASIVADLLGDDIDGAACLLEDGELLGFFRDDF